MLTRGQRKVKSGQARPDQAVPALAKSAGELMRPLNRHAPYTLRTSLCADDHESARKDWSHCFYHFARHRNRIAAANCVGRSAFES